MTKTNTARLFFSAVVYAALVYGIYAAPSLQLRFVLCIFAICASVVSHRVLNCLLDSEGSSIKAELLILGNGPEGQKEIRGYFDKNSPAIIYDAVMAFLVIVYAGYQLYLLSR